jgi:RimJ/RimL family protein N-acetyltransferase
MSKIDTNKIQTKIVLETDRLILREFTLDDTRFIIELLNTPGWLKFIGDRNVKTEKQAIAYLQDGPLKSYKENGFGLAAVELKTEKTPIGMCGILKRNNLDNPDIGFAFLPQFIGKGYAFEIANATLIFAKNIWQLPVVSAITLPDNKSSINLLEKIGLRFVKPFTFPGSSEELMLYSTTNQS